MLLGPTGPTALERIEKNVKNYLVCAFSDLAVDYENCLFLLFHGHVILVHFHYIIVKFITFL